MHSLAVALVAFLEGHFNGGFCVCSTLAPPINFRFSSQVLWHFFDIHACLPLLMLKLLYTGS